MGLAPALVACLAALWGAGCDEGRAEVHVTQPIAFSHAKHLAYFRSGQHRDEHITMHLERLEMDEAPAAITKGLCRKCHAQMEELIPRCAGCHRPAQDAKLRERTDVRACLGCHRDAWTGSPAGIPSNVVCRDCHEASARTSDPEEVRLRKFLADKRDIPWIQLHTTAPSVHFSHAAHVRMGGMPCTTCHEDMSQLQAPPTSVTVFQMTKCIRCHEEHQATAECITCHK